MSIVFGECAKHPGNNLVNCQLCAMEKPLTLLIDTNKINVSEQNYVSVSEKLIKFTTDHREALGNVYPFIRQKAISLRKDEKDKDKFLSQLLHEVWQVMDGFAQDEVWSDYDESVRQRVIELQKCLLSRRKDESE